MPNLSASIPGSKSYTNRALLMAGLACGKTTLNHALLADDTQVMIQALKDLGVKIQQKGTTLTVTSTGQLKQAKKPLYLGNAGTAVRFLTAILANEPFTTRIEGDARMHERPLKDLLDALTTMGAKIESNNGCPPLTIHGKPLTEKSVQIQGNLSSQYISALLILAPRLPHGLTLKIEGKLTSKPYVEMTLYLMNKFFIQTPKKAPGRTLKILHQNYQPTTLTIEADVSSASYFFGLAAITGKTITVKNIFSKTLQPDIQILKHLKKMGCQIQEGKNQITIRGPLSPKTLKPLGTVNANEFPDGAMTLAVVSAFAKGKTTLKGLGNLKIKESDRLSALATELRRMGIKVKELKDGLIIFGNAKSLHPATIETYNDHRMAMCFGMAGCVLPGLVIKNPSCVGKTYPGFWEDLKKIKNHSRAEGKNFCEHFQGRNAENHDPRRFAPM